MDTDLKLFRDLMLAIWDHHEKPGQYSNAEAQAIYEDICGRFVPFGNRSQVEARLPSEENVKPDVEKRYLYLNPVTHGSIMLPMVTLKSDFGRSIPEVRFQLGLFLRHNEQMRWIGFRFEAPEGRGISGSGRHNYYHIQMIRGLHSGIALPFNEHLEWIPDAEPTFPVDANGSVKLLLSILVSLYGIDEVITLIGHAATGSQLQTYLSEMNCHRIDDLEWYWKVTRGKKAKSEYWKSSKQPSDFQAMISAKYAGSTISGVTKGTFDGAGKHKTYS